MKMSSEELMKKIESSHIKYRLCYRGEILADSESFWKKLFGTEKLELHQRSFTWKDGKPMLELEFDPKEDCRVDSIEVWFIESGYIWSLKGSLNFPDVILSKKDRLNVNVTLEEYWNGK